MQQSSDINNYSSSEELQSNGFKNRKKVIIVIIIIAAVVIAASALLFLFFKGSTSLEMDNKNYAVLYSKNGSTFLKSNSGECKLSIEKIKEIVKSEDGKRLFYLSKSSYGSEKLDLHCCELDDSSQISKGGFIVDFGIEDGFYINSDGSDVIYSKMNDSGSAVVSYLYNMKDEKAAEITSSIMDVYVFSNDNIIYFTKKLGSTTALFKYTFGGTPVQIAADVKNVLQFKANSHCELLYQVTQIRTKTSDLYIISGNSTPKLISAGVTDVFSDEYSAWGNLYYLKKSEKVTNWGDIIPDDMKAQDELITEPQKSDYVFFFGFSFEYNKDLQEYQSKLERDGLRSALDKLVIEEKLIPEQLDCYVYKNDSTFKIAEGVSSASISSVSKTAEPMVIYNKIQYLPSDTVFSDLADIMKTGDEEDAAKIAEQIIKKAVISEGLYLSCSSNVQGTGLEIDNTDSKNCVFGFSSDGSTLYSLIKDSQGLKSTLYKSSIVNGNISERQVIDANITSLSFFGDKLLYLQLDAGKSEGSLFEYSAGVSEKIMASVYSYFCLDDSSILILRNYKESQSEPSANLYYFKDGGSGLIDDNVALLNLRYHNLKSITYIRNFNTGVGGELCVINGGDLKVLDSGVSEILMF